MIPTESLGPLEDNGPNGDTLTEIGSPRSTTTDERPETSSPADISAVKMAKTTDGDVNTYYRGHI